ncbi:MAG: hypothetical protein K2X44_05155 [Magnetospirillum sp.]|nr:hypothetical protein [Magnetospirillum sp.]
MRLVFVNHCHPQTPHVCAARVRNFAEACARAGHQVVLLTESLEGEGDSIAPAQLTAALAGHDWRRPYHLACAPIPGRLVARLRDGGVPRLFRRPLLAAAYLMRSGLFTDWRDGSKPYWPVLAHTFRPHAIWGTFGNTDAWAIARGIARMAGCRWVMDMKDPWSVFIPAPLRRILAARFADAADATALSAGHGQEVRTWFGRHAAVIYSGIDDGFLPPPPAMVTNARVLVVGALYGQPHLAALLDGIRQWNAAAVVTYVGSEGERFRAAAAGLTVETPGYVDLPRLRELAAAAQALLYVRNPQALYQHKLVELLALDRPILCLPPESGEAEALAVSLGAAFRSCGNAGDVAAGLAQLAPRPVDRAALAAYGWDAQARALLAVLGGGQ